VAENPRIADLRRRLEAEPQSRLFAQLAEELRKDGSVDEAVQVCREGLERHPNYPSARMTLGRALLDMGDVRAARGEFETVLKTAPDNILASRFLAECLEGLGDLAGAVARYRTTLMMAPGDKQLQAKLSALELRLASQARPAPAPAPAPADDEPIAVLPVDGAFELEQAAEPAAGWGAVPAPTPQPGSAPGAGVPPAPPEPVPLEMPRQEDEDLPPIPLVAADEAFEIERALEPPEPPVPAPAPAPRPQVERPAPAPAETFAVTEFDFEPAVEPAAAAPEAPAPALAPPPAEVEAVEPLFEAEPMAAEPVLPEPMTAEPLVEAGPSPAAPEPELTPSGGQAPGAPEIASPTLAELYYGQGFKEQAVEVYRQCLAREPGNERARERLAAITAELRSEGPAASVDPRDARRHAIQRTIERLEGLLAAVVAARRG